MTAEYGTHAYLTRLAHDPSWNPYVEQDWQSIYSIHRDVPEAVGWYAELAADPNCPHQKPMLDLLYFATGEVVFVKGGNASASVRAELQRLIDRYEGTDAFGAQMQRWAWRADELLSGEREFNYDYWCDSGFQWEA
jgi:hypothetical protein